MNIDLPNDPSLAFQHGWAEALQEVISTLNRKRDAYLMPRNKKEQVAYQNIQDMLDIVHEHMDIRATIAKRQDRQ